MKEIRLLYVEDEADIREVASFALEGEGFELLLCASGSEALEQAEAFRPDLILLDVMMPGMDGQTTFRHLREIVALQHVPAIFLTAKVQSQQVDELMRLGAVEVIAKPFDPLGLAAQIRTIWRGLSSTRS